jgi:hypothetical protein
MKGADEDLLSEPGWPTVITLLSLDVVAPLSNSIGLEVPPLAWPTVRESARQAHALIRPDPDNLLYLADEHVVREQTRVFVGVCASTDHDLPHRLSRLARLGSRYMGSEGLVARAWRQTFGDISRFCDEHATLHPLLHPSFSQPICEAERSLRHLEATLAELNRSMNASPWDSSVLHAFAGPMGDIPYLDTFFDLAEVHTLESLTSRLDAEDPVRFDVLLSLHRTLRSSFFPLSALTRFSS